MEIIKKFFTRRNAHRFIIYFVIFLLMWFFVWMRKTFERINFDEVAIVLQIGMSGVDGDLFWSFFNKVIFRAFGYGVVTTMLAHVLNRYKVAQYAIFIVALGLTAYCGYTANIQCGNMCSFTKSDFYEREYIDPNTTQIKFDAPRNVLVIALESMEKSYADTELWGDNLIPHITEMEQKNVSFDNYLTVDGWTHTIAAITGMVSGLPMFFTSYRNIEKMLGATGIGTVFKNHGYNTLSLFPASGQFSLKSNFLTRMGFDNVYDGVKLFEISGNKDAERPFDGLDDGTFFETAKPIVEDFIAQGTPYLIFMETINTHCKGYYTQACRDLGFAQDTQQDIVKCDDRLIFDFVQWFRAQDPNAVVILINDHKQHTGAMMDKLRNKQERMLNNVFINTDVFGYEYKNRLVSAADFFPTIIEAAGGKIDGCRLGLGTALSARCADIKTLRERYDADDLSRLLQQKNDLYYRLATGIK